MYYEDTKLLFDDICLEGRHWELKLFTHLETFIH